MAKRTKALGLPVRRKRRSGVPKAVLWAGVVAAAAPALVGVGRRATGGAKKGEPAVDGAKQAGEAVASIGEKVTRSAKPLSKFGRAAKGVGGGSSGSGGVKLSHLIEEHIDVAVPRTTAYNQWTQFDEFARL